MKYFLTLLLLCCTCLRGAAFMEHYSTRDGLPTPEVWQIIPLPNHLLLVQTVGGFSLFNGQRFEPLVCPPERTWSLKEFGGYAHWWQGDSLLWLRDYYHLYLLHAHQMAFAPISASLLQQPGVKELANSRQVVSANERPALLRAQQWLDSLKAGENVPQVTSVCRDHEGGWWIGTLTDGIYYRSTPAPWVTNVPLTGIRTASRAGNNLLVLGSERDILLFDTQQRRVVRTLKAGCGKCFDAMSDERGNVWVSTATGLYRYADGQLVRFDASNCQGLLHSQMRFARGPLPDGRMLVCNLQHYLGLFDPTKKVFTPLNKAFPQLERHRLLTEACALDKDKKRYAVFSQNGMVFLRQEAKHFTVSRSSLDTEKFNCAYRDSKGRIWVGTQNGLLLMRGDGYRRFTQRDGLRNVCINSLAEDGLGQLWIGTAFGIEKLRLTDQDTLFVSYGKATGMPETLMCERAAAVMPDGKVWMASTEGLVCIEPDLLEKSARRYASKVLLLDIENEEGKFPVTDKVIKTAYDRNSLLLKVTLADYSAAGRIRYRYKLADLESGWTVVHHADGPLAIRYRALSPGTYTFQIQAACDTGEWGPLTEKVIQVQPPFWLSGWAKMVYVLCCLLLAALGIRLYLRHVKRRMDRQNEEKVHRLFELREEARHQFAQNLHVNAQKLSATDEEAHLMEQLLKAIEQNMANADYTVDQLAADVALGRSNLYRRMQSMLGITPNDFLRSVRLKRAATLLAETSLPVGDIARAVGFGSPRYFSQYFKKMFGVTPSAYGKRGGGGESEKVEE